MDNPLGDSPAAEANPLGDRVVGNPLGDQPAGNPLGDAPASPPDTSTLSPLGKVVSEANAKAVAEGIIPKAPGTKAPPFATEDKTDALIPESVAQASVPLATRLVKAVEAGGLNNPVRAALAAAQPVDQKSAEYGVAQSGAETARALTTPTNIGLALLGAGAPAIIGRGIAAYFAAATAANIPAQGRKVVETAMDPNATPADVGKTAADLAISGTITALAGKGALTPGKLAAPRALPTTQTTADALGYLDLKRTEAVKQWVDSPDPKTTIVTAKDAVNSATERAANAAAIDVTHDLGKHFDESQLPEARKALVPAVESGLDPARLEAMKQTLDQATYKTPEALAAAHEFTNSINFALEHLDDLKDAVDKHNAITSAIYDHAQDSGIEFPKRDNYVLHAQDIETPEGFADALRSGGTGASFRMQRTFDTYPDSIAAGIVPKVTDGIDLLRAAVRSTQGMVNNNLWTDAISQMKDPTNGAPLLVPREADPNGVLKTPPGYAPTEVGGRPMAIQNGYAGLFENMKDPSKVPPLLSKINATGKSITLAIDTYHLGRLAFYQAASELGRGELPLPHYKGGLVLGDTPMSVVEDMAKKGEIEARDLPRIREDKAIIDQGVNAGLNVGRISDSMHQEWVQKVPVLGNVNKFIFQQFQRGAIYDMYVKEFRHQQLEHPELSNETIASQVAKDVNTRLGNLGNSSVFNRVMGKTGADLARLIFLAPQWNEALIRSETGAFSELAKAAKDSLKTNRFTPGLLGRTAATLAVGGFAANQLINLMTRGYPTWQNPEEGLGSKLSAWVPDVIGSGPGFFLNPMTLPMEVSHLLMTAFKRTGDWRDAANSYFRGRLSTIGRAVADLVTKHDALGRLLTTVGTLADAVPLPIAGSTAVNAVKQAATGVPAESFPGQFQKQTMATFGLRTDSAPSPTQRIRALANEFKRDHGIQNNAEFYSGDYTPLVQALRVGNTSDAAKAIEDLLSKKTPEAIRDHFQHSWTIPFTGSRSREQQFYAGLTTEQKAAYRQAQTDARKISMEGVKALRYYLASRRAAPVSP